MMTRSRLEAFSDGVIAIVLTIMMLDLKAPATAEISGLRPVIPAFLGYVLSFVHVGIYWNNHHHLFQAVRSVNGSVLLANLHLLFWISLVPFVTSWMGSSCFAQWPVVIYGMVLLLSAVAYFFLGQLLIRHHGRESTIAKALASDFKGKVSLLLYVVGIGLAFVHSWLACGVYSFVALMWLIPDRRIESTISNQQS